MLGDYIKTLSTAVTDLGDVRLLLKKSPIDIYHCDQCVTTVRASHGFCGPHTVKHEEGLENIMLLDRGGC